MAVEMKELKSREDWLEYRKPGLGGSEIAAVIGCSPYMDNVTLWEYKTGRRQREDISDKPFVRYGTEAEVHLRELFKLDFPEYKVEYVEHNSWRNSRYPWAKASLDGWITDKKGRRGVLEIKTTEILQASQWDRWDGRVPQNYYCQVLYYMAVTEADFACIKVQIKTVKDGRPVLVTRHYFIERSDVQEDIDFLMAKGAEFWQYVERDERPPLVLPAA